MIAALNPLSQLTRVPLRLRVFFRGAFALLALATLALSFGVLVDEKQRGLRGYAEGLKKNAAQAAARLRHPTGQLALLNPGAAEGSGPPRPLLLPFAAIDFDDRGKARQAVEMAGCAWQYADGSTLCLALGSNPYAGGYVYAVARFAGGGDWVAHQPGDLEMASSHRVAIDVDYRGGRWRWVAPYEVAADGRGRLVGFEGFEPNEPLPRGTRPQREFRGWVWQEGPTTFLSFRLPIEPLRDALAAVRAPGQAPEWPPRDVERLSIRLRALPPADGAVLFDSHAPGATLAFSLADLRDLLAPGETLTVRRVGDKTELLSLRGARETPEPISPWLSQLIRRLPADGYDAPVVAVENIATPVGRVQIELHGDIRSVNQRLAAVATRISGFVGAMLGAVLATWLLLEVRIIRRVTLLTKRAAAVSTGVRRADGSAGELAALDLSDLRGRDELGVLAQGLKDLLQRVNDDVRREQIRAQQEKDMWHAVGHEIMSPLQSLMALHGRAGDPAERYITRMQQAVRVLYGQASPSEAFETTALSLQAVDLDAFLGHVAGNAAHIGIDAVAYTGAAAPLWVRADEYALEDVLTHLLRNAARHREPSTPIRLSLSAEAGTAQVTVHNAGEGIAPELIERIFEYGVSGPGDEAAPGQRGQGLFVARTYMAKMGGTVEARNVDGGVEFVLTLQRAAAAA